MPHSHFICLVDDDADYRFLVQQVFKMFLPQHQLQFFANGAELADHLDRLSIQYAVAPRVILLDIDMPVLNGFQTLVKLKQHDYWQAVPVIMMTNRDQAEFRLESFRLKASAFSLKPMSIMEIKAVMTAICEHDGDFTTLYPH